MELSTRLGIKFIVWCVFFIVVFVRGISYAIANPVRAGIAVSIIAGIGYVALLESEIPMIREHLRRKR